MRMCQCGGRPPWHVHICCCSPIHRFLHFLFWLSSYHELNDNYSGVRGIVGSALRAPHLLVHSWPCSGVRGLFECPGLLSGDLCVARLYPYCAITIARRSWLSVLVGCRYVVLGMQFLQMLIMMNFFYYYLKSAAIGGDMELPLPTHLAAV